MAYVYRPEEEENTSSGQNQPQAQISSAPLAAGVSQSTGEGQKPSKSGSWVNLNQYLKNQPQIEQTAQKLVGEPEKKTRIAQEAITQTQSQYASKLPSGVSQQQKELLSNALLNKGDVKKAQQTFQQLAATKTPGAIDATKYQPAYEEARRINESKQKDVGEQLQDIYGSAQSVGKQALDVFALRNDPTARNLLEQSKQTAVERQKQLDQLLTKNKELEKKGQMTAKEIQAYVKDLQTKAQERYKGGEEIIKKRFEGLRLPYEKNLQIQNLIQNNQDLTPEQAKVLGIDHQTYQGALADYRSQQSRFANIPAYNDPQHRNLAELNTQIAQLSRGYNVDDFLQKYPDSLEVLMNPTGPAANAQFKDFAKMNNITVNEAKQLLPPLLRMGPRSAGFFRNPTSLPTLDAPTYADYLSVNALPSSYQQTISQDEARRLNELNAVFGLGRNQVTGGAGVQNQQYGPKIDERQYFKDLYNYLQGVLATPKNK